MKKLTMLGLALALASMAGVGGASVANARDTRPRDFTGVWRLEARRGDVGPQAGWLGRDGFRQGRQGSQYGWRQFHGGMVLPGLIRIERSRRTLQVETRAGRVLREIDLRHQNRNRDALRVSTIGPNGQRITEVFRLREDGGELVVRTTISGPRGSREFTSVYDRT